MHGSTGSAAIWTFRKSEAAERGWASYASDLRGHGRSDAIDLSHTGMQDYPAGVRSMAGQLHGPLDEKATGRSG